MKHLNPGNSGLDERRQLRGITVHNATPGGPVDPSFSAGRRALGFEGFDVDGFGHAVEGHVDYGCHSAGGCSACSCVEALPVAAGIVDVNVGVDESGQKKQIAKVVGVARHRQSHSRRKSP